MPAIDTLSRDISITGITARIVSSKLAQARRLERDEI
jgi:hypothetical protein